MGEKPDQHLSDPWGHISHDNHGDAVWEWRTDTGTFKSDVDTLRVKALQEAADLQLGETPRSPGMDPYSTVDVRTDSATKPARRTLNDMRVLSEEIKRARSRKLSE